MEGNELPGQAGSHSVPMCKGRCQEHLAQPCPGLADVPVVPIRAVSPVEAGLAGALVDVGVAEVPEEAPSARAGEAPQGIVAGPPVQAWLGQALINFHLTVRTFKSRENKPQA